MNQFCIELGLTEEQKQQIVPVLTDAAKQLQTLKKNTSLKPMDKLEQLKQIAGSVDEKVTPLLNAEQQQKFQAIRDEHRRQLVEKMAGQIKQKVESEARKVVPDLVHKLEGLDSKTP
jgi:Mg/Co/Ni transporter MgtE